MMDMRRTMRGLVILMVVIILFSPVVENSAGMRLEKTIQPQSHDVTITNLTFSESEPEEGENITINVTVNNTNFTEVKTVNLILRVAGTNISVFINKNIPKGGKRKFNSSWEAIGGTHRITATLTYDTKELTESEEIWVEPDPMGDIYSPMLALGFIFVVVFGSVLIPSLIASLTNRSSTRKEE